MTKHSTLNNTVVGICIVLAIHYVYSASVSMTPVSTTTTTNRHTTHRHHHKHRPTHSPEKVEHDLISFHYDQYAIEKMMVAKEGKQCFCYPLSGEEIKKIHEPIQLLKLEGYLLHQIQQGAYYNWTMDDLAVRSTYYSHFCPSDGDIYRVHRL